MTLCYNVIIKNLVYYKKMFIIFYLYILSILIIEQFSFIIELKKLIITLKYEFVSILIYEYACKYNYLNC
jgi:hypothetical protein